MYTFCKKYGNRILLRESGGVIDKVTKHSWNLYFDDVNGKYKSIYGKSLRKDTYPTLKKATDELKGMTGRSLMAYGAKNFGYQYIRDKFLHQDPITPKQLYIANIDIETGRDDKGYSPASEARCPVTSITLNNVSGGEYIVWGYHSDGYIPKDDNVKYVNCYDEMDMLAKFVTFISIKHPDVITGWNCVPSDSFVFGYDNIYKINDVNVNDYAYDGSDFNNKINYIFPKEKKDNYVINLASGRNIESSKDHIFNILYARNGRYTALSHNKKSSDILFEDDFKLSDIPVDEYSCFMKIPYHLNTNKDVVEYSDWELYMAGLIYTDGSISDKKKRSNGYRIYQSDYEFLETFDDVLETTIVGNRIKGFSRRVKHSLIKNVVDLIYDDNNYKLLNVHKISLLSYRQFMIFLSGILDGDGYISSNSVEICNYEGNDFHNISLLCQWNGMYTTEHNNRVRFLNINWDCLCLRKYSRWENFRPQFNFGRNSSQLSEKIRYQMVGNDLYVRIDDIKYKESNVEMMDIKTDSHYFISQGVKSHNCDQYDITYIVNRVMGLFDDGADMIGSLSPFGIVNEKESHDGFGNTHQIYDIVGIAILDYLALFKKFTYTTPENYKLDTVAHLILGDKKIDYSEYANLQDLYNRNYEKFIDYNIKDVEIVTRMDGKLKLFDLILSVAYKAGINYNDVVSPVTTWDVLIYNAVMDSGIVPSCETPNNEGGQYVGAVVKEPIPSMYKWIVSADLNSLYPHLQMGINISPEKRIPDSKLPPELTDIRKLLGTAEQGIQLLLDEKIDTSVLRKYDVSLSPNGQFYRRDSDGFIPIILEGLYNERKTVKRSMLDDKQLMENDSSLELGDQISQKNTLQMALKILMNSEYGALANKYFRYFDLRNAEAVTSSGQLAILWVAKYLNEYLNGLLETNDFDYVVAIDTDSVYLNLEKLVDKFIPIKETGKIVSILDRWAKDKLEPEINRIYDNLAKYVNAHKQKMVMSREVIADKAFWTGKKRYALNVHDNEGVRYTKPKTKIMGLECVRSSVPEFCRNYIKDGIVKVLTEDEEHIQNFILDVKDEFMKQPPEEISFPRGTNNIEKWMDESGFPKKGCPIHVRGCIVYNKYLSDHGYTDEKIQSGDKIKFCHLKQPNMFRSHVVAYPPDMNQEAYQELVENIDQFAQWEGTFFKPVDVIMEVVGWSGEKVVKIDDFCGGEYY